LQCCAAAGVQLMHDWRFKSLPPAAYPAELLPHFFSFHKVLVFFVLESARVRQALEFTLSLFLSRFLVASLTLAVSGL
jgi:hypothetical protein